MNRQIVSLILLLLGVVAAMPARAQFWYEDQPGSGEVGNVKVRTYYPISCETDPPSDKTDWVERTRRIREDNGAFIEGVRYFDLNVTMSVEGYLVVQTGIILLRCDQVTGQRYQWQLFEPRAQDRMFIANLSGFRDLDTFVEYNSNLMQNQAKLYIDLNKNLKQSVLRKLEKGKSAKVSFELYHAVPNQDVLQFKDSDMIKVLFKGYSFYAPHIEINLTLQKNAAGKIEIINNSASFNK